VLLYLVEKTRDYLPVFPVSCTKKQGLERIGEAIFQMLEIIRVYAKDPTSKGPSRKPLVIERGARAIDIAKKLHSELFKRFKYARIWGPGAKYPGEKVGSEHIMQDRDIIEIH